MDPEIITCAAILLPKKKENELDVFVSVPRPVRHHHIIHALARAGMEIPIVGEQGFMTSKGRFVDRDVARDIARSAGQLLGRASDGQSLFSEDVW